MFQVQALMTEIVYLQLQHEPSDVFLFVIISYDSFSSFFQTSSFHQQNFVKTLLQSVYATVVMNKSFDSGKSFCNF